MIIRNNIQKILNITSTSEIKRISFRKDINILRAVAVLAVVFYHAEIEFFRGGWLGVDIFFVISGYLISNIIISELNEGKFSFRKFYIKRIKRILPALVSTLLFTIPLAYFFLSPVPMLEYGKSLMSSLFFYSNYYFNSLDFYNSEPSKFFPLLHTWSLSIEEQFYILFPGFIVLIFKFKKSYLFALVSSIFFISVFMNSLTGESEKFYLIQYRIWELLFGCLIMIISQNLKIRKTSEIGFILIGFSIIFFDDSLVNNIEPKLIATLGASLVIASPSKKLNINNYLTSGLERIGLISYSLYLFHQPVYAFFRIFLKKQQIEESLLIIFIIFLFLIMLSNVNYKYVESAFLNTKSLNLKYFIFFIPIILFSFYININKGITPQFEDVYFSLEKYYQQDQRGGVDEEFCNEISPNYNYCEIGNQNLPNIVVIGDSHLTTLTKYLYNNLDLNKYSYIVSTEQGCPFFLASGVSNRGSCSDERKALSVISKINTESVVIFGGRFPRYFKGFDFSSNLGSIEDDVEENPLLIVDIENSIKYLSQNSKTLILLYPIPELGVYPLDLYLDKILDIDESLNYDRKYWDEYSSEINFYFDNVDLDNVKKILSDEIICNSFIVNKCTASINEIMLYWDDDHLTYDGASYIGDEILYILENN
tara:strand:+ start:987 stop:2939 length:1953 start_codon:yes stop_codon:yes gene_type:complete